jgi:hypothetical protein
VDSNVPAVLCRVLLELQFTAGYRRVLQGTVGTPGYYRLLQGTIGCYRLLQSAVYWRYV